MSNSASSDLTIRPVKSRADLKAFIRVPNALYKNDPCAVTRLQLERSQHFSDKNPFFQHASWQAWTAYQGGKAIGRISAQIDRLYQQQHSNSTGFFGSLEAPNDERTFKALFAAAEGWLAERNVKKVIGPMNLGINQEVGLLIEGFTTPPHFMMGHALPYFAPRVEDCNYQKAVDVLAYVLDVNTPFPNVMQGVIKRSSKHISIRPLDKKNAEKDLLIMRSIFNESWQSNWGFVPFTENEFLEIGEAMLKLTEPKWMQIASFKDEPSAFSVVLPNINEIAADLNGRLLPFGWLKLLWRLKAAYPKTVRIPLMGVLKKHQSAFSGAALAFRMTEGIANAVRKKGVTTAEFSWILESNTGLRKIIETVSGPAYKKYRIYEKTLSPNSQFAE